MIVRWTATALRQTWAKSAASPAKSLPTLVNALRAHERIERQEMAAGFTSGGKSPEKPS
jgi:hypothetical protein